MASGAYSLELAVDSKRIKLRAGFRKGLPELAGTYKVAEVAKGLKRRPVVQIDTICMLKTHRAISLSCSRRDQWEVGIMGRRVISVSMFTLIATAAAMARASNHDHR